LAVEEQARRDTILERLTGLSTVYGGPTVTAGKAPGLNDGATPTSSARLPAHAMLQVLDRTFAATAVVSVGVLAGGDPARMETLAERTNPNGGAVAVGHPVGASGARITLTANLEARRRGGGPGVAAICGGFGQADALLFETI
jgi:acetyl-CoA C-acetyltransferase